MTIWSTVFGQRVQLYLEMEVGRRPWNSVAESQSFGDFMEAWVRLVEGI